MIFFFFAYFGFGFFFFFFPLLAASGPSCGTENLRCVTWELACQRTDFLVVACGLWGCGVRALEHTVSIVVVLELSSCGAWAALGYSSCSVWP